MKTLMVALVFLVPIFAGDSYGAKSLADVTAVSEVDFAFAYCGPLLSFPLFTDLKSEAETRLKIGQVAIDPKAEPSLVLHPHCVEIKLEGKDAGIGYAIQLSLSMDRYVTLESGGKVVGTTWSSSTLRTCSKSRCTESIKTDFKELLDDFLLDRLKARETAAKEATAKK